MLSTLGVEKETYHKNSIDDKPLDAGNHLDDDGSNENLITEYQKKMLSSSLWSSHDIKILKDWAEQAHVYVWLHDKASRFYTIIDLCTAIPVIAIGVVTGTANFANQDTLIAMIFGSLILTGGLITTIVKYTKVTELKEQHHRQCLDWKKFYRNIKLETNKPPLERSHKRTFIDLMKKEFDRLEDEMPNIPIRYIKQFKKKYRITTMSLPLVLTNMKELETYQPSETDQIDSQDDQIEEEKNDELVIRMKFIEKYQREPTENELKDLMQILV